MTITGTTRLYAILGDPLSKARTPERFNALFAQRGVDAVMVPAEVDAAGFDAAVAGFKRLRNCDGLIVTMPHKRAMLRHVDELHENGKRVGAINATRRMPDGRWIGDMFDGRGYVGALRAHGIELEGKRVHMIGAGAVARAMAFALAQGGIAAISLRDVDRSRADDVARAVHAAFPRVRSEAVDADCYDCEILANATPLGLRDGDPLPCEPSRIAPATVVTDVIPKPEITPLLAAARARGCVISTGRDMVEAQIELIAAFLGLPAQAERA
jgi:shikimate 5-dehydrogenase